MILLIFSFFLILSIFFCLLEEILECEEFEIDLNLIEILSVFLDEILYLVVWLIRIVCFWL